MTQVFEYITQNYIWFLVGAIVILLAIIGYYADKTNFGQGKNTENKENDKSSIDIDDVGLMDATSNFANKEQNLDLQNTSDKETTNLPNSQMLSTIQTEAIQKNTQGDASGITNMQLPIVDSIGHSSSQETLKSSNVNGIENELVASNMDSNNISEAISKQFSIDNSSIIFDDKTIEKQKQEAKQREEEFNKFNAEFNSILPKKELINDDLLGEIDDLKLGKTQKLDLNDLTNFEKIDLPRISSVVIEEQDIWKF